MSVSGWVSTAWLAQRLGISTPTARALLNDGRVPLRFVRMPGRRTIYRIDKTAAEKWLAAFEMASSKEARRRSLLWRRKRRSPNATAMAEKGGRAG